MIFLSRDSPSPKVDECTIQISNGAHENLQDTAHAQEDAPVHKRMTHSVVDIFEHITFQITAVLL